MNRTTLLRALFGVALAGALALELLGEKRPYVHPWDWPLFFAIAGLVGCLLLSVVAKGIVAPVLDRPQSFYDTDAKEYEEVEARFQGRDADAGVGSGRPPAAETTPTPAHPAGATPGPDRAASGHASSRPSSEGRG